MTQDELRSLISRYVAERLSEWEDAWYLSPDGEKPPACETEGNDWQEYLALFSTSAVEDHAKALSVNDLSSIGSTLQDFLQRYRLERVEQDKRMTAWLSRELIKAEQRIAREVAERVRGNFADGPSPAVPYVPFEPVRKEQPPAVIAAGPLLSVLVKDYLAHYEHRSKGTLTQKQTVLNRFIELIGDKPASSYVKKDCIRYREMLRKVPANASKRFRVYLCLRLSNAQKGLPESDMLSKVTVNGDLTHLGHMFSWLINEEHHAGPNPAENL